MSWKKAGEISAEVLAYGKKLAVPGVKLCELADKIEKKIEALGGKVAFPTNLSLNHIAAHYTPPPNDKTVLCEKDILKIDVGAQINGFIGDTALTIGPNKELIKASEEALKEAIKITAPGTEVRIIGKAISETIRSFGFSPIANLSGHQLGKYVLHAGITIPNYDNGDCTTLKEGQVIAIEPFATDGEGAVKNGKPSGIYRLDKLGTPRHLLARKVLQFIKEEYRTLPFSKRAITKKFPSSTFALLMLEKNGIIYQYDQLPERSRGLVSQTEHTIMVKDKPIVLTKRREG